MTTYTEVFGGSNIYPSDVSYLSFNLSAADVTLAWPVETNAPDPAADYVAAAIMDINSTGSGRKVYLPAADQTGVGQCILFNNKGSTNFTIVSYTGTVICTLVPGSLWQVYLTDNTTSGGTWVSYQFGSTTSQANAGALAGAGLKAITTTLNQAITIFSVSSNYTLGVSERAKLVSWTGASGTVSLTAAGTLGSDWFCYLRNNGSSSITIDPDGAELINGSAALTMAANASAMLICDGTGFYTVGLGEAAPTGFDYTTFSVAGSGNYTLSGAELNRISYKLTGILTGNRNIIVPASVQQYWINNATTGAYTLTVKTSAGAGITVAQGESQILYCDGTDVVEAETGGVSVPIAIADGGTGATTASAARTNLGATTVGNALFTAASAADARTTIDAITPYDATAFTLAMS